MNNFSTIALKAHLQTVLSQLTIVNVSLVFVSFLDRQYHYCTIVSYTEPRESYFLPEEVYIYNNNSKAIFCENKVNVVEKTDQSSQGSSRGISRGSSHFY